MCLERPTNATSSFDLEITLKAPVFVALTLHLSQTTLLTDPNTMPLHPFYRPWVACLASAAELPSKATNTTLHDSNCSSSASTLSNALPLTGPPPYFTRTGLQQAPKAMQDRRTCSRLIMLVLAFLACTATAFLAPSQRQISSTLLQRPHHQQQRRKGALSAVDVNDLFQGYMGLIHTHPLLTKCATSACIVPLGDLSAQFIETYKAKQLSQKENRMRTWKTSASTGNARCVSLFLEQPCSRSGITTTSSGLTVSSLRPRTRSV